MWHSVVRYALLIMLIVGLLQVFSTDQAASQSQAGPPEIWLRAGAHVTNGAPAWRGIRDDSGEMWSTDAPWQTVAKSIRVVFLAPGNVMGASDEDLQRVMQDTK